MKNHYCQAKLTSSESCSSLRKFIPMITRGLAHTILTLLIIFVFPYVSRGQSGVLEVEVNSNATELAQELVGPGVVVTNATLVCGSTGSGFFSGAPKSLGIDSGVFLGSGSIHNAVGPNSAEGITTAFGIPGDPELTVLAGANTNDACVLEFDVKPFGDTLSFDYVFGSDEYDEYVCSGFNDVFAFFITGPNPAGGNYSNQNVALIPGTNLGVAINTVNNGSPGSNGSPGGCTSLSYSQYYQSNAGSQTLEYDGQTTVLQAVLEVQPCETYHLELKVADAGDALFDSGVFLKSKSLSSNSSQVNVSSNNSSYPNLVEGCLDGKMVLNRSSGNGVQFIDLAYGGSATKGIDYTNLQNSYFFQNGQTSLSFTITPYLDTLFEGSEDLIIYIINPCNGLPMDSATISILDSIDIEHMPDTSVCMGDTIQLWAADGQNYYWDNDSTVLDVNFDTATILPTRSFSYQVEGTIGLCSDFDNINVEVVPVPEVDAGLDTNLCLGTAYQFGATYSNTQNPTYLWQPDSALAQTIIPNPFTVPLKSTEFFVTVTNEGICSAKDSVNVNVYSFPQAYAGNDKTICRGEAVTINLQTNRPGTAVWSPVSGLDTNGGMQINASPSSTTTYTVEFTDTVGCQATDKIKVNVNPLPNVSANAGIIPNICQGDTINLLATGANSYQWTPASIVDDPIAQNTFAIPDTSGPIYLSGTDLNGCTNYDTISVTVNPVPSVDISFAQDSICEGDTMDLTASGDGSYTWLSSAGNVITGDSSISVSPNTTTSYTLTVENQFNCIEAKEQTITVIPNPMVDAGNDTTICESSKTSLNGSGADTYQWSPGNGLSCTNCEDPQLTGDTTTIYTLTGFNDFGCVASDEVKIDVTPLPNVMVSPTQAEICLGESVQLSAAGGIAYQWTPATGLSAPNSKVTMAAPTATTTYTVEILDVSGCEAIKTVEVTVNPLPNVNAGQDQNICLGETTTLSGAGANNYTWSPATGLNSSNISNPEVNISQTQTYTLTGTDANGCKNTDEVEVTVLPLPNAQASPAQTICENEVTQLTASGGVSYNWSPSLGLSCITCKDPFLKAVTSTTYTVNVTDQFGCTDEATTNVDVLPAPNTDAGQDQEVCHYESAQLSATGAISYQWSPTSGLDDSRISNPVAKPDSTTKYYVTGTGANGCSSTDSVIVAYFPVTQVDATGETTICETEVAILSASGVNSYQWTPTGSLDDPNKASPKAIPLTTTTYTVTGTDVNGCTSTDDVTISVNPLPDITSDPADTTICKFTSVQLLASGGETYRWSPATGLNNPDIANPLASPGDSTQYQVIVSSDKGCMDSLPVNINVFPPTDPSPHPSEAAICPGDTILLTAQGGESYQWTPASQLFMDDSDSIYVSPSINTVYTVSIIDSFGCEFSSEAVVDVHPDPIADAGEDRRVFYTESTTLNGYGNGNPLWYPDKWLDDPADIMKPQSTPDSTITYYLTITTQYGCVATDSVNLEVFYETKMYMPNAFTPNRDGKNDRIGPVWFNEFELHQFTIYNRWGEIVFSTNDPNDHWDGTINGEPQPMGTYVYIIKGQGNRGESFYKQGNITLIR